MKQSLTSFSARYGKAWRYPYGYLIKPPFFSLFVLPLMIFLFAGISTVAAQGDCSSWWRPIYLDVESGVQDGDTVHLYSCQVPWMIMTTDLKYYRELKYGVGPIPRGLKLKTHVYRDVVPDDSTFDGMYQLWKYEYIIEDDYCYRTWKKTFYVAMYDNGAPTFQSFPRDTAVASLADLPPVDEKVIITDFCQYVAWWNVETEAIVDTTSGDTLYFLRTWSAGDPSGNKSSKSQKIWINPDTVNQNLALRPLSSRSSSSVSDFKVYPNPSKNVVYVDIRSDGNLHFTVFDALGRSVLNGNYLHGQSINLDNLKAGVYHLQLRNQKEILGTKKVLLVE